MIIRTENSVYEIETTEREDDNIFKITKVESFNPLSVFNEVGTVRYATAMSVGVGTGAIFKNERSTQEMPMGMWHTSVVEAIEI